ncbi:hypothetical protein CFP56_029950 [Quercus suber]|uniref:Uncharacterized protein n=1 Tax=Quercus suber TaxID=58331 RepID=A0AAW0JPH7_QUESU
MLYEQEIGKLLCQMYLLKSPGPGGMPGLLFKPYWKSIYRVHVRITSHLKLFSVVQFDIFLSLKNLLETKIKMVNHIILVLSLLAFAPVLWLLHRILVLCRISALQTLLAQVLAQL